LPAHLAPDAVDVLRPTRDLGADPRRGELAMQPVNDLLDVALAVEPALVEELRYRPVGFGLERAQREGLELPFKRQEAGGFRERRELLERLASRPLARLDRRRPTRHQ